MLQGAFDGLQAQHQIVQLGERRILGALSAHVDDPFLESDDLTGGDHGSAFQNVGAAASHGLHLRHPAGEHAAFAGYLYPGFDDVLHRSDAHGFTGSRNVQFAARKGLVLQDEGLYLVFVDVQSGAFHLAFGSELNIRDLDDTQF